MEPIVKLPNPRAVETKTTPSMAKHNDEDRGSTKTPRTLKANVKTYKVDKGKESHNKKRDLFLAGTGRKQIVSSAGAIRKDPRNRKKKKKKRTAEEHPLAKAFTGEFADSFFVSELESPGLCGMPLGDTGILLFLLLWSSD